MRSLAGTAAATAVPAAAGRRGAELPRAHRLRAVLGLAPPRSVAPLPSPSGLAVHEAVDLDSLAVLVASMVEALLEQEAPQQEMGDER